MCGIAGIASPHLGDTLECRAARMAELQFHRGPDDGGVMLFDECGEPFAVALASRRLSILDLSPAGHQPMSNEDGSVWTVFNGEIYNFVRLRSKLESRGHHFRSRT